MLERPRKLRPRPRAGTARKPGLLARLDQRALVLLRTRGHTPATERIAGALGTFGEWGLGWLAMGLAGAALDRDRSRAWSTAAAVGPAAVAINYGFKLAIGRERPLLEDHPRLARAPSKLSFPSAHATSSTAAATAIARVRPGLGFAVGPLAASICLCRPFLGMHYPSDVIAGAVLGTIIGRGWPLGPTGATREVWAR